MARTVATVKYLMHAAPLLSSAAGFTVCLWWRPDSLTPAARAPILYSYDSGTGNEWGLYWNTDGTVDFAATAYTGTDPATSSKTAAFTAIDVAHGKRVLFRYDGTAWVVWTGSRTGGLTKKTISASIAFGLPGMSTGATLLGTDLVAFAAGGVAEVLVTPHVVSDADAELLLRGVAADQIDGAGYFTTFGGGLASGYWPLRGTAALGTEPNYLFLPDLTTGSMTLAGSPATETHPEVYGRDELRDPVAAWALEIQHGDGTVRAATMDLTDPVDVDVLGAAYPARITNADTVVVAKNIQDGIATPGSTTVILTAGTAHAAPQEIRGLAAWLEADQIRTADDGDTVTLWPDASGRGLDAEQYSSSGPTYVADASNGRPALLFDADTEALDLVSRCPTTGSDEYTIIAVFDRADADTASHAVLSGFGAGWILYTDSGSVKIDMGSTLMLGAVKAINTPYVVSYVHRGSVGFGRVDQGAWQTAAASAHPGTNIVVGCNNGPGLHLDGRIYGVFVVARAMGEDEITRAENYLAAKYGDAAVPHQVLSRASEWRDVRAILRRYEQRSHELVTELVGVISGVDFSRPGLAAFTIIGASQAILNERVPKALVNVDEHPSATDLLAPIPVGCGDFWVSAPYVGHDESTSPGTADFVVSHIEDAAGADMALDVRRVLFDIYTGFPGLEEATSWYEVGGTTPTKHSTTVLQLSGDYESFYEAGMPIRITVSGTEYYTTVVSYDNVNDRVTVADAVISVNPTKVELLAGAYLVQSSEYQSGSADLLTVRFVGTGFGGGVVVFGRNTSLQNPADVIAEILKNQVWGLNETIDDALFDVAVADFLAAGLGSACNNALGGDRQQQSARTVLGQLLALRGAWLELQADGSWGLFVDKPPAWEQSRTFTLGDKRFPQLAQVVGHGNTPLGQAVKTLKLRFRRKGRSASSKDVTSWIAPSDFELQVNRAVLAFGTDRVETSPWLDRATHAGRVVVYRGKRMAAEDESINIRVGFAGRNVGLGEILRLVGPLQQVDGNYRVVGYDRALHQTTLRTVGYDPAIFDFDASEVAYDDGSGTNTNSGTFDRDESGEPAVGANLVLNPNFALGLSTPAFVPAPTQANVAKLPGWIIYEESGGGVNDISALAPARSEKWVGNCYLQLTIAATAGNPQLRTNSRLDATLTNGGIVVEPGKPYVFSLYATETSTTKPADAKGFALVAEYFEADGTSITSETLKIRATGEMTGPNTERAMRWWGVTRAPADAAYAQLTIKFTATGTYQLGAVAFNRANRFLWAPPPWAPSGLAE